MVIFFLQKMYTNKAHVFLEFHARGNFCYQYGVYFVLPGF